MPRIAFIINRNVNLKLFAPIIEAALKRRWITECWLQMDDQVHGLKAYLSPTLDDVAHFQEGEVVVRSFKANQACLKLVTESKVDAVISLQHKTRYIAEETPNCCFVSLQYAFDNFKIATPQALASSDLICLFTPFWLDWAIAYYAASDQGTMTQVRRLLADKVVFTGIPELDIVNQLDKVAIRQRWGISPEQPVVLLLPVTLGNKAGSWTRFFAAKSKWQQALHLTMGSLLEDWNFFWQYQSWLKQGWNDAHLIESIRQFCDANGAYLLVKGRLKDPIRDSLAQVSDRILYDESYYPATVLEAMRIANLCIHFYSSATLEISYLGVPGLNIHRPSQRVKQRVEPPVVHQMIRNSWPDNLYNYDGVSNWMTIPQVSTDLPTTALSHFQIDAEARKTYVEKFVGPTDGESSQRVLNAVESWLNGR